MGAKIQPGFSLYLDVIRFGAALVVLLSHLWPLLFPAMPLPWPGHEAVVVFFVLSGYVIAYATFRPGVTLRQYAAHRAVRILTVAIPAIILSLAIVPFVAGGASVPNAGNMSPSPAEVWRAVWLNILFLGEFWPNNIRPPFNEPYWSLTFEVWYYMIFAAAVFTPRRWRMAAVLAIMALAGPRMLVLFPIWLMGVWLYRTPMHVSRRSARALFVASAVCAFAFFWTGGSHLIRAYLRQQFPAFMDQLYGGNQFVGDILLGIMVTAHFAAARVLAEDFTILVRFQAWIRYLASFTLSTYLFHMPLAVLIWNGLEVRAPAMFGVLLVGGIFVLGSLTERRNLHYRERLARMQRSFQLFLARSRPIA